MPAHGFERAVRTARSLRPTSRRLAIAGGLSLLVLAAAACGSSSLVTPSTTTSTAKPSVSVLLSEGQAAQNSGNPREAQLFYTEAVDAAPTNAAALYDLADVEQLDLGQPSEAEAHYRSALAADPNFVDALFNLAVLVTNSAPQQAEADYQKVIKIDPKYAAAHLNLGYVLIELAHVAQGEAQLREAARLDPAYDKDLPGAKSTTPGATTTAVVPTT